MSLRSGLAFFALALVTTAVAQDPRVSQVTRAAEDYLAQGKVPGFTVAISENGKVVYAKGFGSVNTQAEAPAGPLTLYRLASVSKPLTAFAVMKLVEQGKVKLDDDIRTYVPNFPDKGVKITVRNILSHQSGIRHYVAGHTDGGKHYATCNDALEVFANDPLLFNPGERYSYSTHAFTLLGALIENVTHSSYDDALESTLRKPAQVQTPRVENRQDDDSSRSELYTLSADKSFRWIRPDDLTWKMPGGGTEATAVDLCKLGSAVLDGKIVSESTLRAMWTPQRTNDGKTTTYGLGWAIGADHVDHSGSQAGAESIWILYPAQKVVVTVLSNLQGNPIEKLGSQIAGIWLRR